MKRIGLFILLSIYSVSNALGYDIEVDQLQYLLNVETSTVSYCGISSEYKRSYINIPSSIEYNGRNLPVVSIEANAFRSGYKAPTEVTIPNSVLEIKPEAFPYNCPLVKITIEDGDQPIITAYAYDGPLLTTGQTEGKGCFGYCTKLEEIYIGRNLDFSDYNTLKYGFTPFYRSCVKKVTFGPKVSVIQPSLFWNASSLSELYLTDSVEEIGESAFCMCPIENSFKIPSKLTIIHSSTFSYSKFKVIDLNSDNLLEIGNTAFAGNTNSYHPTKAECEEIILGKNVNKIGSCAFSQQKGVKKFTSFNPIPPVIDANQSTDFLPSNVYADATLFVPQGSAEKYKNADIWKYFWNIKEMESTGVNDVDFDAVDEKVAIYDLSGNSKENIANGINIIVYKSGKIVKLLKTLIPQHYYK